MIKYHESLFEFVKQFVIFLLIYQWEKEDLRNIKVTKESFNLDFYPKKVFAVKHYFENDTFNAFVYLFIPISFAHFCIYLCGLCTCWK